MLGQVSPPLFEDGNWIIDASGQRSFDLPNAIQLFTRELEPTRLDRQKMERVSQVNINIEHIHKSVGKHLTILRGRGGTGKTVHLLQLAKQLYDEEGARILLLTYNKALVADIRRLLSILGIESSLTSRSIHIQTVHSFLFSILQGLGLLDDQQIDFLAEYEDLKKEALTFLTTGTVTAEDLDQLVSLNRSAFKWEYIFVDEGQDWPDDERKILLHLYSKKRFVVADGVDQLVRSRQLANWRNDVAKQSIKVFPLRRCLRMKAGLARFISSVAKYLDLPYTNWLANEEVAGGRVVVIEASYFQDQSLHEQLLQENANDGNQPVDMLFCVPPSLVIRNPETDVSNSVAASTFQQWGFPVWDGASEDIRNSYPTEVGQLRIVQYDSCRGLGKVGLLSTWHWILFINGN